MSGTLDLGANVFTVPYPYDFGTGTDGAATLDGVNTFSWASLSGGVYTLLRSVFLTNLTISAGKTLVTGPYMVFATGTLTNAGIIDNSALDPGDPGAAGTGGLNGVSGNIQPSGALGAPEFTVFNNSYNGADGTTGDGQLGELTVAIEGLDIAAGNSGGGGNGTGHNGVGGQTGTLPSASAKALYLNRLSNTLIIGANGAAAAAGSGAGSAGGSSGGGDGVNTGGAGGGGGSCGGCVALIVNTINNTGTIQANGSAGGAGESPTVGNVGGGGGGAGGPGGIIYIIAKTWVAVGTMHVNGGAGGAAGSHHGTGTNGTAGTAGATGVILRYNCSTASWF